VPSFFIQPTSSNITLGKRCIGKTNYHGTVVLHYAFLYVTGNGFYRQVNQESENNSSQAVNKSYSINNKCIFKIEIYQLCLQRDKNNLIN
jgi:hypothetical protein